MIYCVVLFVLNLNYISWYYVFFFIFEQEIYFQFVFIWFSEDDDIIVSNVIFCFSEVFLDKNNVR